MPNVTQLPMYELTELLKEASEELLEREEQIHWNDYGYKLAINVKDSITLYCNYNDERVID